MLQLGCLFCWITALVKANHVTVDMGEFIRVNSFANLYLSCDTISIEPISLFSKLTVITPIIQMNWNFLFLNQHSPISSAYSVYQAIANITDIV